MKRTLLAVLVFSCALAGFGPRAASAAVTPIILNVDISHAPERIYHCTVTMPAKPGPFTFVYPKWIPGFHGPVGPEQSVVNMTVSAKGSPIGWRRDLVEFYSVHTTVPDGASSIDVSFDVVGAPVSTGEENLQTSQHVAIVQWSSVVMYPEGAIADETPVQTTLRLPAGWSFGSALPVKSQSGSTVTFDTVSLTRLVDSPLNSGDHSKKIQLDATHELDISADSDAALDAPTSFVTGMKHLAAEGPALYGSEHYRYYHFLLTLSDQIKSNGIEHHESSDNRAEEKYITDADTFKTFADLMPHEFSHSWNGKYRRPADLLVADFQAPEKTDLLWVYEGLNQYLGEVLTARSRLETLQNRLDGLAISAASMDVESGRSWRPIRDVADTAPLLYITPQQFGAVRRQAGDFYTEGTLIWLEADTIIRKESGDKKSIDDFLHLWASGGSRTPSVKTYTVADVIATLNATVPYDWANFVATHITNVAPRAPLGGIENAGWKLVYSQTPSELYKAREQDTKLIDDSYSLGFTVSTDGDKGGGEIIDVLSDSLAGHAGIAPLMKIVAVNGRLFSEDAMRDALKASATNGRGIDLIVANGDFVSTYHLAATGPRYPHLERIPGTPDLLREIYAPKTFMPDDGHHS